MAGGFLLYIPGERKAADEVQTSPFSPDGEGILA